MNIEQREQTINLYYSKIMNLVYDIDTSNKEKDNIDNEFDKNIINLIMRSIREDNKKDKIDLNLSNYKNIYFTSDLHLGHKNILKYENRDKKLNISTIQEHDDKLIQNWNSIVTKDDLVFILGDVSFYGAKKTNELIKCLNGEKILILR